MTLPAPLSRFSSQLIRSLGNGISALAGENRVSILNYHRILEKSDPLLESEPDIAAFTWQMETLAACFNVLPLYEAVLAIRENRVPPRAVCISFDDGYRSSHDLALPVLRRLGLPATVFVTSGFLDEGNMWNDRIVEAVRRLPEGNHDLRSVEMGMQTLSSLTDRIKIAKHLNDDSKYLSQDGRLDVILKLEELAGQSPSNNLMLTREMVANLSRSGIEIGGHTITHPILTKLDDDAARHEIVENKRVLEEIVGQPLRLFAYPNGKIGMDFDQRHVKMVQAAGYVAAFTTAYGVATKDDPAFQIPRSRPWDATPFRFSLRLLSWLANNEKKDLSAEGHSMHRDDPMRQKENALLIAFHFPPQAESSGIQRTLSFSKNLQAQDWQPSVLSAHAMAYERTNTSQMAQLSPDTQVRRAWVLDAKHHLGLFGRYPQLLALPDRWATWWFTAVPLGLIMMRRNNSKVIWTTYPIATAHLIGLTLKSLTGKMWVADFRDPMTQADYPSNPWQRKIFRWIERKTLLHCDAAVFTTQSARDTYVKRYPNCPEEKFHVIENGYDEDGFGGQELPPRDRARSPGEKITLLHSGVLYEGGRDPSAFFAAIASLKQGGIVNALSLRVVLRAPGEIDYFQRLILQYEIDDIVFVEAPISYQQALAEMLAADGLLVFQGTPFNTQIPAKIYEYFRARKPIFGLLDPLGETARVLAKAGFHHIADMQCADAIATKLTDFLTKIDSGKVYIATEELILSSSRKHRAHQLAQVFDQISQHART